MSADRLSARFAQCRSAGRAALVTFVTGGDPTPADTGAILDALVAGGPDVPLVLMGYANPMIRRGPKWFAEQAKTAGVDGVICVDLPPEEDAELGPDLRAAGLHLIRLATPTTDAQRLPQVVDGASGFLYYVSVAGITGKQQAALQSIEAAVKHLKSGTQLPIAVGFGVRTPEQAGAIGEVADGVVVGSAIVDIVGTHGSHAAPFVQEYVASLRAALEARETAR